MRVMVSHSQRQHSYQLAYGLQKNRKLGKFYTGVFFGSKNRNRLFQRLFKRRSFDRLDGERVVSTLWPEVVYQLMLRLNFNGFKAKRVCDRVHDKIVSKKIKSEKYDVIIGYEQQSYLSFAQAKKEGKLTVLDADSIHPLYKKRLNEEFDNVITGYKPNQEIDKEVELKSREYALADYIITLSTFAKKTYVESGIPEEKLLILNLGVDTEKFVPISVYHTDRFELLFVAGLRHWKGIKDLVEVFQSLHLPDATLNIVGNQADAQEYLETQTDHSIRLIDRVEQSELVQFYQSASVLILPSYMDSWGQVAAEAMACGTAVIVSENTGISDIVENGVNGFVVTTGDQSSLKEKINYFYNNRHEIERMGKNARKSVESLSWENYYSNLNVLMEQIGTEHLENSQ